MDILRLLDHAFNTPFSRLTLLDLCVSFTLGFMLFLVMELPFREGEATDEAKD